jgi:hypothetical protein
MGCVMERLKTLDSPHSQMSAIFNLIMSNINWKLRCVYPPKSQHDEFLLIKIIKRNKPRLNQLHKKYPQEYFLFNIFHIFFGNTVGFLNI